MGMEMIHSQPRTDWSERHPEFYTVLTSSQPLEFSDDDSGSFPYLYNPLRVYSIVPSIDVTRFVSLKKTEIFSVEAER